MNLFCLKYDNKQAIYNNPEFCRPDNNPDVNSLASLLLTVGRVSVAGFDRSWYPVTDSRKVKKYNFLCIVCKKAWKLVIASGRLENW